MNGDAAPAQISDNEFEAVSGGLNTGAACDKCTSDEFPKEGVRFGAWNDGRFSSCGSLCDNGRFMKCGKCGFKENSRKSSLAVKSNKK